MNFAGMSVFFPLAHILSLSEGHTSFCCFWVWIYILSRLCQTGALSSKWQPEVFFGHCGSRLSAAIASATALHQRKTPGALVQRLWLEITGTVGHRNERILKVCQKTKSEIDLLFVFLKLLAGVCRHGCWWCLALNEYTVCDMLWHLDVTQTALHQVNAMEGKLREQYREGVHSMSPKKTPSLQTPPSHDIKAIQNPNSSAKLI